ncbi:RNA dependent RNA polymerase-domain-containing protein [Xylariaceae sp. FL0804]|nr:RNA dependent RNA polymerase-domain-containing protein [Xylariaceae sp. FL0804]
MTPRYGPGLGSVSVAVSEQDSIAPSTPSRRRAENFDTWFLEFSNLYSLNLRRPDPALSPRQKKALPDYNELVYYDRLKVHYYSGNGEELRRLFDEGAREIHCRWVNKPLGEPDVTPAYSQLPRATSEPERQQLVNLLHRILDHLGPEKSPHLFTKARSTASVRSSLPSEDPPSPSLNRRCKRNSDEWDSSQPTSKRSRSSAERATRSEYLSDLDRGSVLSMSGMTSSLQLPEPSFKRSLHRLPSSVNTSKSSFPSRIFSEDHENHGYPSSQETQVRSKPLPLSQLSAIRADPEEAMSLHRQSFSTNSELARSDFPKASASGFVGGDRGSLEPAAETRGIERRLEDVWPLIPSHLDKAPLAVRWEIMRIALSCGIDPAGLRIEYDQSLNDQTRLRERLQALPLFHGKILPEKSRPEVWAAALTNNFCSSGQVVILSASLTLNTSKLGPLFHLQLQPLKLDLPHRLDRRFGSDRFIELVIPAMSAFTMQKLGDEALGNIQRWLVRSSHVLLGRLWTAFFVRFVRDAQKKKVYKEDTLKPEVTKIPQERVYLFAEDGNDFVSPTKDMHLSSKGEPLSAHSKMGRDKMLDWLLQLERQANRNQPLLKLFQRIPLGLSRTHKTVVLRPEQIRHQVHDIRSPANKVMNDGIARMSPALARQVRDLMGLPDIPAGYQGRLGSAKGFWIRDTTDTTDDIWIETMPSQRKWECDYMEEDHRTFEVSGYAKELKSSALNTQLLPILEDRAVRPKDMKMLVGNYLKDGLLQEIDAQRVAMQDPTQFRLWVHDNTPGRPLEGRVRSGQVPWSGGLPTKREDQMELLLSQGFEPTKLQFLRNMAFALRKEKCEELHTKLNVKIGRSTYAYMVVDFLGVLEEDEVHLGFSSKFRDEQSGFSETFLHGIDILVARTPAHYPSDIQKVKAVFKPELGSLKDVIVFPTKGNIPLADKLSGGDYDGDAAWICWEPAIVDNFENAPLPSIPNLFEENVLSKDTRTYQDLLSSYTDQEVVPEFLALAFGFNLEANLLGVCTKYKDKLCYSRKSVGDDTAIWMSTLISHLVDRAKQGIIFTEKDWNRVRKELNGKQADPSRRKHHLDPPQPQYENNEWSVRGAVPTHIRDYVKFAVAKPTIETALRELNETLGEAEPYDADLTEFCKYYEKLKRPSEKHQTTTSKSSFGKPTTWETIFENLKKDIDAVAMAWRDADRGEDFQVKLARCYGRWRAIAPATTASNSNKIGSSNSSSNSSSSSSKTVRALREDSSAAVGLSTWDLLKASYCFKMYYRKAAAFPWFMAGHQLGHLKALQVSSRRGDGGGGGVEGLGLGDAPPVLLTPGMYVGARPDAKFARAVAALRDGGGGGSSISGSIFEDDDDDGLDGGVRDEDF